MSGRRTVVIGAGIAGILAAIAAAAHSESVTVVERDGTASAGAPRKGIPQGHHAHTLLASGRAAMEALCPGLQADLLAAGATPVDFCADFAFFHYGVWKSRCTSAYAGSIQTRFLLERLLWQRLRALPNIHLMQPCVVEGIALDAGGGVAGVRTLSLADRATVHLPCDLLIDASGRGSRLTSLLAALGVAPPQDEIVRIDLRYASAHYTLSPQAARDWQALLIYPKAPFGRRAGYVFATEGDRHLVTLAGYFGDAPGADHEAFLRFARTLGHRQIYEELARAVPLSEVRTFRFPEQRRRRFDRLRAMPRGLVALGDAVCLLDPLFGQGMSVAAAQALTLDRFLSRGREAAGDWRRLRRDLMEPTRIPWLLTSSEAFRYADAEGHRSILHPVLQWYAARVFIASAEDPAVYRRFMGLMHLTAPLHSVFAPRVAASALAPARAAADPSRQVPPVPALAAGAPAPSR